MLKSNAKIKATVLDANGQPVAGAFVDVFHGDFSGGAFAASESNPSFFSFFGSTDENGQVTLDVLADYTYQIVSWLPYIEDEEILQPAPVTKTPSEGQTLEVILQAPTPDSRFNFTATGPQGVDLSFIFCSVFNKHSNSFVDLENGQGSVLMFANGASVQGICEGFSNDKYYSTGVMELLSQSAISAFDITDYDIEAMLAEAGNFFKQQQSSHNPASAIKITLPDDCSTFEAAANALKTEAVQESSNPNQITIKIGTPNNALAITENAQPKDPFEIEILTADGKSIGDFSSAATLTLCYDENSLGGLKGQAAALGFDEAKLTAVAGNKENNSGLKVRSAKVNADQNKLSLSINYSSSYGVNVASVSTTSSIAAPAAVQVKKAKAKKKKKSGDKDSDDSSKSKKKKKSKKLDLQVSFSAVENATGYVVRMNHVDDEGNSVNTDQTVSTSAAKKGKKKKKKKKDKEQDEDGLSVSYKLKESGTYSFSVATLDSEGNRSPFTAGDKSFTLKAKKKKDKNDKKKDKKKKK